MPVVRVHRKKQLADYFRAYEILVDGEKKAALRPGASAEFDVTNGVHRIVVKIDWCGSREIEFSLWGEETAEFECGNNTGGFRSLFYVMFKPGDYLWLRKQ